jgi:hypothetical protein
MERRIELRTAAFSVKKTVKTVSVAAAAAIILGLVLWRTRSGEFDAEELTRARSEVLVGRHRYLPDTPDFKLLRDQEYKRRLDQGSLEDLEQFLHACGFLKEFVCACFHTLHRGCDASVCGQHQNRQVRFLLLNPPEQVESADTRHFEVCDDSIQPVKHIGFESIFGMGSSTD